LINADNDNKNIDKYNHLNYFSNLKKNSNDQNKNLNDSTKNENFSSEYEINNNKINIIKVKNCKYMHKICNAMR
jgi:hypothetical protein